MSARPTSRTAAAGSLVLVTTLAAALVAATAAFAGPGPGPSDDTTTRPAVPIRRPLPVTPKAAAGTGVAPAVAARIAIDATGRVTDVTVLSIRPASRFDAAFRDEVVGTLSEWRFAPALDRGRPVASIIERTVQFTPRDAGTLETLDAFGSAFDWGGLLGSGRATGRSRWDEFVSSLDRPARRSLLDEMEAAAEEQFGSPRRDRHATEDFTVVTDSVPGTAALFAGHLETAYRAAASLLAGRVKPLPPAGRVSAFVYEKRRGFDALQTRFDVEERLDGFYRGPGLIALHLELDAEEFREQAARHEAVHAYLERHVARPGIDLPLWLNEGTAEYVANSDTQNGRIVLGATGKRMIRFTTPRHDMDAKRQAWQSATTVSRALDAGRTIPLAQLAATGRGRFTSSERELFYAQSWLFVHFLRHGRPGWDTGAFPNLLLYVGEGYPPDEAFRAAYGARPGSFETAWRDHVRDLIRTFDAPG